MYVINAVRYNIVNKYVSSKIDLEFKSSIERPFKLLKDISNWWRAGSWQLFTLMLFPPLFLRRQPENEAIPFPLHSWSRTGQWEGLGISLLTLALTIHNTFSIPVSALHVGLELAGSKYHHYKVLNACRDCMYTQCFWTLLIYIHSWSYTYRQLQVVYSAVWVTKYTLTRHVVYDIF